MLVNERHLTELNAPIQRIKARVELYRGSTLENICNCGETLRDFTIERTGENKFFGFGICQKLSGTLIDLHNEIEITKEHTIEAAFGVAENYIYSFPKFYIQEYKRDETSGSVSFSAYDILYKAENYTFADLDFTERYTVQTVAAACANLLEVPLKFINVEDNLIETLYDATVEGSQPNFTGKESIRKVLDTIAEFTQTVYYISNEWELVFRRLNPAEEPALKVYMDQYITCEDSGSRRLKNIMSVTEGEDNVHTEGEGEGVTQFIRNNPFLTLRDDIGSLLDQAQANVGGMSIGQFNMNWSGNYLLEVGDRIEIETETSSIFTYLLDDAITFDGGLTQVTGWTFDDNEGERDSNPTTIGEALNETYIRVDKANKKIEMLVSESNATKDAIASLQLTTNSINASVTEVQKEVENRFEGIEGDLVSVKNEVAAAITSEDLTIEINKVIENGVDKVETSTGFTFNEEGLTVEKTNSEMKTQITEDGMTVYRSGREVLTANSEGVQAEDLHATTYLIVGSNSRFENYKSTRTACFWIGD